MKKIILIVIGLILIGAGLFYWWHNQADVRELNKDLPDGIRVGKTMLGLGNGYRVVNKIDNYEFKIPPEWGGLYEINYYPQRTEMGYTGSSLNVEGKYGEGRVAGIDQFTSGGDMDSDLKLWAEAQSTAFGFIDNFNRKSINQIDIVRTQENVHLGGEQTYFFREDFVIYSVTGVSEKFIEYIILNGKW